MFKPVYGIVLLPLASACAPAAPRPNENQSRVEPTGRVAETAPSTERSAVAVDCTDKTFVACASSEACTMRGGELVVPQKCFVHAADACSVIACEFGCDIYHGAIGEPEQIRCAIGAPSSGNMKRCAGYSNWACPEQMTCQGVAPNARDAEGICVPNG